LVTNLEVAKKPARRDAGVPARLAVRNQDGELKQFGKGRPAEFAQRRFGDCEVATFYRSLEDRPRVRRRCGRSDMRHTALTNLAAAGASPIAVMATAGHRSMQTTKRYLHLAGVTFQADADALERRLLGELSTDLGAPETISGDVSDGTMRPHASAS
jgi:integrase